MTKPHILLLQHDDFIADEWDAQLSPHARLTWADSHNALRLLKEHEDTISIVVVDSYITPDEAATLELLEKIYDFNPDLDLVIAASNTLETEKNYYQWGSMTSRRGLRKFLDSYFPRAVNTNTPPEVIAAPVATATPVTSNTGYKPKVLCVEDLAEYQEMWANQLAGKVKITQAFTLSDAYKIVDAQLTSFDIIVMDACVPGEDPTTPPLVKKIREMGFKGPILAASGAWRFRQILMNEGCSHDTGGKGNVGSIVLQLIPEIIAAKSKSESSTPSAQKPSAKRSKRKLGQPVQGG